MLFVGAPQLSAGNMGINSAGTGLAHSLQPIWNPYPARRRCYGGRYEILRQRRMQARMVIGAIVGTIGGIGSREYLVAA